VAARSAVVTTVSAHLQTVVRLAEQSQNPDGSFRIRVSFGDAAQYDVTVADPADQAGEARLAWYFEEHLRYPFLDKDLEQDATGRIVAYGAALFQQVFGGLASQRYRALRDRALTAAGSRSPGRRDCTGCTGRRCETRTCRCRWRSGCRSPAASMR
jgi:hypothetical protein